MWFWLLANIVGSLLGAASTKYIKDTKFGIWLYKKVDQMAAWAADRYDIDILNKEEIAWRSKYPNVAKQIDDINARAVETEKQLDNLITALNKRND